MEETTAKRIVTELHAIHVLRSKGGITRRVAVMQEAQLWELANVLGLIDEVGEILAH